jgi:glycosyltransferase involved in cell wall biosynthesis
MPTIVDASETPLAHIAVLVPCWQPGPELSSIVAALQPYNFGAILVVDDGGGEPFAHIFNELVQLPRVKVLHHAVNLGKGRALKTGFNALLAGHPDIHAVVTADADSQHRLADIVSVASAVAAEPTPRFVLGVRVFAHDVPLRSRFGNQLTRLVFRLITGVPIADTQTGLRGIPRSLLPELMQLTGERYEYEMSMLAHLCRGGQRPLEVPIETVYIDDNRGSHFDPVRDSMRIYFVLLRFYSSSLFAALIDFLGFTIAFAATHHLPTSIAVGRLSSLVNFALNRGFVFNSRAQVASSLVRYYILAIAVAILSYGLIRSATVYLHWNVFAAKIVFDVLLSLVSFSVQRTFVFRRRDLD